MTAPSSRSGTSPEPPSTDGAGRTGRRAVVLGALGAGALATAGFLLLSGGSDDAALVASPAAAATAPATAGPPPSTPAASAPVTPVAGAGSRAARDPFHALHSAPSAVAPDDPDAQPPTGAGTGPAGAVGAQPRGAVPGASAPAASRTLVLQAVEGTGEELTAVFSLDGAVQRAQVGASFGPGAALLLVSLRQAPDPSGWTAVVRTAGGDPLDVRTGAHTHLP